MKNQYELEKLQAGYDYVIGIDEVGRGPWAGSVVASAVCLNQTNLSDELSSQAMDSKKLTAKKREILSVEILANHFVGIGEASVEEVDSLNIRQATFLAMERAVANLLDSARMQRATEHADSPSGDPRMGHSSELGLPLNLFQPQKPLSPIQSDSDSSSSFASHKQKKLFLSIDGRDFPPCFANDGKLAKQINKKFNTNLNSNIRVESLISGEAVIKGDDKVLSISCASIVAKVYRDKQMKELSKRFPYYGWERNAGYGTKIHQEGLQSHGITEYHRKSFKPIKAILENNSWQDKNNLAE